MNYKSFIAFFLLFFLSHNSWSMGGQVGNGGDILVCNNYSSELLDIYESRESNWGFTLDLGSDDLSIIEKVRVSLKRLARLSPRLADKYQRRLSRFFSDALFKRNINLVDIPDSDHIYIPDDCVLEQIAIHREPDFTGENRYVVDEDLWDLLDKNNKAALILHEIIIRDQDKYGYKNSRFVRYFTAWLSSIEFETASQVKFDQVLRENNWGIDLIYDEIYIDPYKKIERYPNGVIKSAYLSDRKNSYLNYNGQKLLLKRGATIYFHDNGYLEAVHMDDSKPIKKFKAHIVGRDVWLKYGWTRFNKNGVLISGYFAGKERYTINGYDFVLYDYFITYANKKFDHVDLASNSVAIYLKVCDCEVKVASYSPMYFHANGEFSIISLHKDAEVEIKIQNKLVKIRNFIRLYEDGSFKSGGIKKSVSLRYYNRDFKMHNYIWLHENKNLAGTYLKSPMQFIVQDKKIKIDANIYLYENGQLKKGELVRETSFFIAGNQAKLRGEIELSRDNQIESAYLSRSTKLNIQNTKTEFFSKIKFSSNKVIAGIMRNSTYLDIQGNPVLMSSHVITNNAPNIVLNDFGVVTFGIIAEPTTFIDINQNQIRLEAPCFVSFNDQGFLEDYRSTSQWEDTCL